MKLLKIDIDDSTDVSNVTLPKEYLDGLKETFRTVVDFLNEHNIEYFIDGGTLLGCVRDGGQIPWDDDIDIGMTPSNYNKFRSLAVQFSKNRFQITESGNVIKIINPNIAFIRNIKVEDDENIIDTEPRYACIDIFEYILVKKHYVISHPKNRILFKGAEYHKDDLYPLKEYQYENIKVKGANNPENYLNNYYGEWKKRCIHIYK